MLAKRFPILFRLVITLSLTCGFVLSDPLDITLLSKPPRPTSSESWFRGYALQDDKDIRHLSVGILYKNIDGETNVTWDDTGASGAITRAQTIDMPDGKIFHTSSSITYRIYSDHTFLGVTNVQTHADRVGVFSFEANKTGVVTNSAVVLTFTSANIVMEHKTITVGIGESVTINLSKGGDIDDLRWRHNYGEEIHNLRGNTSAVIENIRRKDDGVYECYTGHSPDGNHGIMRLIVRACPSAKWNPPDCEMDCPVCFNSGVCDDKAGICICPAGFQGNSCQTGCGNNNWGRECKVVCSSAGNCRGFLLCPPDPVGCACINGFGGSDCDTVCEDGYYGAGCREKCNCDIISCTQDTGCTSGSTCLFGYTGDRCLEPVSCQSGYFGVLCNFPCHCKDSEECNRDGSCTNGCHEAWAGPNCSIALPYRTESQRDINQTATTLTFVVTWIPGEDYGTGTITKRKLSYKSSQMDSFTSIVKSDSDVLFVIDNLIPNTQVQFYSQFSRMVGGIEVDGPRSELETTNTICEEPLEKPEIEVKSVEDNQVNLSLKPVSSDYDRIKCNYILRYQVKYSDIDGNIQDVVNTTSSSQLEVELSGLSSCTAYVVNARVVNNLEIAGNWGGDITVQTAPSEPSIQSNSFTNDTHLLVKWIASTCDIPDYQVTYHYELSGGEIFQQGTTKETEVVFDEGIGLCIENTFTVLASYLNVKGTSDVMTIILGTDCDQKKQGTVIGVVIGSLFSVVAAVAIILLIFKRFRRLRPEGNVGKSSTSQQNLGLSTVDAEYQNMSEKERGYENIQSTAATKSSAIYVYTKPEKEPTYGNSAEPVYTQPDSDLEPEPEHVYDVTKFENKNEYTNIKSKVAASSTEPVYADPEPEPDLVYEESENEDYKPIELSELHGYVTKHQLKKEFETLRNLFRHPGEDLATQTRRSDISCQDTFHNVLFLTKRCFQLNPDVGSGADYVNAALIERHKGRRAFVVTRTPLSDTTIDFWRLVFYCKSDVIVQLNEMENLTSAEYLPKKINQKQTFGELTVTAKSNFQNEYMTERKLNLGKDNNVQQIILYEVNQWPENKPVPEVDAFVKFIMTIMEGRDATSSINTPITVHCTDGVSRSGLFCLVYSMIEKIRDEKVVDVFQTLKALRSACPTMVDYEIQYNFCYDAALCYLRRCDDGNRVSEEK